MKTINNTSPVMKYCFLHFNYAAITLLYLIVAFPLMLEIVAAQHHQEQQQAQQQPSFVRGKSAKQDRSHQQRHLLKRCFDWLKKDRRRLIESDSQSSIEEHFLLNVEPMASVSSLHNNLQLIEGVNLDSKKVAVSLSDEPNRIPNYQDTNSIDGSIPSAILKTSENRNNDDLEPAGVVGSITSMMSKDDDNVSNEYETPNDSNGRYIPKIFQSTDTILLNDPAYRPFPRWDDKNDDSSIDTTNIMGTMIDFINASMQVYSSNISSTKNHVDHMYGVRTTDHSKDVLYWLPEILYILNFTSTININSQGTNSINILASQRSKDIQRPCTYVPQQKVAPTEQLMKRAYTRLLEIFQSENDGYQNGNADLQQPKKRWVRLFQLLNSNNHTDPDTENSTGVSSSSIPFFMWYGDYTGCNYHNWRTNYSVPLYTVAANVNCQNTIPFPNYQTYVDSAETIDEIAESEQKAYPISSWIDKKPQVVWRGSLTGELQRNESLRGPRYHLMKMIYSSTETNTTSPNDRAMFDVKLTSISKYQLKRFHGVMDYINLSELGGIDGRKNYMNMSKYNEYRAILDVDGNSWSSRFGKLLCYTSVILKVEPKYVDYFHFKRHPRQRVGNNSVGDVDVAFGDNRTTEDELILQPWKHYIPIKYDLSDLMEKVAYATSDKNEGRIKNIIRNANEWCAKYMIRDVVADDVLDVWESYIRILDTYSPSWERQWKEAVPSILSGPLQLIPI